MGTKCNVMCVIPHVTINYDGRKDPETKVQGNCVTSGVHQFIAILPLQEAPECALHNFPHNINHCLSLGRSEFIGTFETQVREQPLCFSCCRRQEYCKLTEPWPEQVSHAANYLEKQGSFIEEIKAKIWAIDGSELPDARSAAKEAVEVPCLLGSFVRSEKFNRASSENSTANNPH